MLGFLDKNLKNFSQPVRDTIGIGILLLLLSYFLNGALGSTYIRGELWVNNGESRQRAAGWTVLLGENEATTNAKGWWTLPVRNGIPGQIRLEVDDGGGHDSAGGVRPPSAIGEVHTFGPWPLWNTFKPMDNLVVDVYPDRPAGRRLLMASSGFVISLVYAQSENPTSRNDSSSMQTAPCALSLNQVRVTQFPGFLRSSGRVYFQMYRDNKLIDGKSLLYGAGVGSKVGQFPVEFDKELWLPARSGSDDRYTGLLSDLTDVADCSVDGSGAIRATPKGHITLKMFADQGDILNSFDLSGALASPNREVNLKGDAKGKAFVSVKVLINGQPIIRINPKDGLAYVRVPPGTFTMGCTRGDPECYEDEGPTRVVTITRGFWMGQTEVTQQAYEKLTGKGNPSQFLGAALPVERVNWYDAQNYCQIAGMHLPTEAQWEYAARAGGRQSRYGELDEIAWYIHNSANRTHPVAQKLPNAWGLYDMLGNVWEWVADWYAYNYAGASQVDPIGPDLSGPISGVTVKVRRGGSWSSSPKQVRVSDRSAGGGMPSNSLSDMGFRCAGELP